MSQQLIGTLLCFVAFAVMIAFFYITGTLEERRQKNEWALGQGPDQLDWGALLSEEVQQYLPDQKIEAIKRYRELTGVGLKEAKDAVEYMMAHPERVPAGGAAAIKRKPAQAYSGVDWNVLLSPEIQACLPNNKIEAIKRYRERTGAGLKESKDAIDAYFANPNDVPAKLRRYDLVDQQASGIRDLLRQGKRAEALKTYRDFTGVDQFTASEAIDALEREVQADRERYQQLHEIDPHAVPPDDTYEDEQRGRPS